MVDGRHVEPTESVGAEHSSTTQSCGRDVGRSCGGRGRDLFTAWLSVRPPSSSAACSPAIPDAAGRVIRTSLADIRRAGVRCAMGWHAERPWAVAAVVWIVTSGPADAAPSRRSVFATNGALAHHARARLSDLALCLTPGASTRSSVGGAASDHRGGGREEDGGEGGHDRPVPDRAAVERVAVLGEQRRAGAGVVVGE
jgi:hypothetical protein